jgi:ribosomal protein S18 acetylase RimI-like enzyme
VTPTEAQTLAVSIRRYEPADREAVRNLHDEALNDVGAHLGRGPWDADLDAIESVYLRAGGEFLVGVLEGRVVAMGALRLDSDGRAWITRMRVSPRLQGQGIGQTLLDSLHRRAAELGYKTLHLDTTVQQTAAQRLYEKNGYRQTGRGTVGPFECLYYERKSGA